MLRERADGAVELPVFDRAIYVAMGAPFFLIGVGALAAGLVNGRLFASAWVAPTALAFLVAGLGIATYCVRVRIQRETGRVTRIVGPLLWRRTVVQIVRPRALRITLRRGEIGDADEATRSTLWLSHEESEEQLELVATWYALARLRKSATELADFLDVELYLDREYQPAEGVSRRDRPGEGAKRYRLRGTGEAAPPPPEIRDPGDPGEPDPELVQLGEADDEPMRW